MALLAQGGRATEDSTYHMETRKSPMKIARTYVLNSSGPPYGDFPGRLGPWPASDGSTGLSVEGGDFGGGAHII